MNSWGNDAENAFGVMATCVAVVKGLRPNAWMGKQGLNCGHRRRPAVEVRGLVVLISRTFEFGGDTFAVMPNLRAIETFCQSAGGGSPSPRPRASWAFPPAAASVRTSHGWSASWARA